MEDWKAELLKQRTDNNDAIAQAHIDAGDCGHGWIRVDHYGNLERIDPDRINITLLPDMANCDHDYMPKTDDGWGIFVCCRCGMRAE